MTTLTTLEVALQSYPIEHRECGYESGCCSACNTPALLCSLEKGHAGPHRHNLREKWGERFAKLVSGEFFGP